jgi:hypothetical protein
MDIDRIAKNFDTDDIPKGGRILVFVMSGILILINFFYLGTRIVKLKEK